MPKLALRGRAKPPLRRERHRLGLAVGGILPSSRSIGEIVEAIDIPIATIRHQRHLALIAGLEPHRGRGRYVEVQSECRGPIKLERTIDLEEVEVRSHLHWTIAGIADRERGHRLTSIKGDRFRSAHIATKGHRRRRRIRIRRYDRVGADLSHRELLTICLLNWHMHSDEAAA